MYGTIQNTLATATVAMTLRAGSFLVDQLAIHAGGMCTCTMCSHSSLLSLLMTQCWYLQGVISVDTLLLDMSAILNQKCKCITPCTHRKSIHLTLSPDNWELYTGTPYQPLSIYTRVHVLNFQEGAKISLQTYRC